MNFCDHTAAQIKQAEIKGKGSYRHKVQKVDKMYMYDENACHFYYT